MAEEQLDSDVTGLVVCRWCRARRSTPAVRVPTFISCGIYLRLSRLALDSKLASGEALEVLRSVGGGGQ